MTNTSTSYQMIKLKKVSIEQIKQQRNTTKKPLNKTMNKETLEEAVKKYCLINNISTDQMIVKNDRSCEFETPITMFTHGAKWAQERMYSEEDMRLAIKKARDISDGKDCFDADDIFLAFLL